MRLLVSGAILLIWAGPGWPWWAHGGLCSQLLVWLAAGWFRMVGELWTGMTGPRGVIIQEASPGFSHVRGKVWERERKNTWGLQVKGWNWHITSDEHHWPKQVPRFKDWEIDSAFYEKSCKVNHKGPGCREEWKLSDIFATNLPHASPIRIYMYVPQFGWAVPSPGSLT